MEKVEVGIEPAVDGSVRRKRLILLLSLRALRYCWRAFFMLNSENFFDSQA